MHKAIPWSLAAVLIVFGLVLSQPTRAQDLNWERAELVEAWINIFLEPEFKVQTVKTASGATATGLNYVQQIDGSDQLYFFMNREVGGSGYHIGFGERETLRRMGIAQGSATSFRKLNVRGGRGVTFRSRGCQFVKAGLRGNASETNSYQFSLEARTCGDAAPFLEYFEKIRPATRNSNTAELAMNMGNQRTTSTQSAKSRLQLECENATGGGDETLLAAFMKRISEAQLAGFLAARMDCNVFAN